MKIKILLLLFCFPVLVCAKNPSCAFAKNSGSTADKQAKQLMKSQPVQFIENKGQMTDMNHNAIPFVFFKAQAPGMDVYVTEKGLTYVFIKSADENEEQEKGILIQKKGDPFIHNDERNEIKWNRIDMSLEGATIKKENIVATGESTNFSDYFLSHCSQGIKNVHSFQKIIIRNIYPGIDWILYNSQEKGFKYDFVVHPGGDYKQIELIYSSLHHLQLNEEGNIEIKTKIGCLTEYAPTSFLNGKEISSKFIQTQAKKNLHDGYDTHIRFSIPDATSSLLKDLIIDPQLTWATFFGGSDIDGPRSLATDVSGNVFVTGYEASTDFPTQDAGTFYQGTNAAIVDAFILKFNASGVLIWSTYYGGSCSDQGNAIAVDNLGNVFVSGWTCSLDFPTQDAGTFFQGTYAGSFTNAFILKFDNSGNRLWATYYGGTGGDMGYGIITDATGNVFVTGSVTSTDFPVQDAGTFYQGSNAGSTDAFILKFDNLGNRLWATYYGGTGDDTGNAIAIGNSGSIFLTGGTTSNSFPTQDAGTFFQPGFGGYYDAFILKFDNPGNRLWATYYGGTSVDETGSITTDASGHVYVLGISYSTDFPTQDAGTFFQGTNAGGYDAIILEFDDLGNRLWATYYGGSGDENVGAFDNLATDACGNVYAGFVTGSTDIVTRASCDEGFNDGVFNEGFNDIFVAEFHAVGNLVWATYLGGNGNDFSAPLATDASNNLFVSGEWTDAAGGISVDNTSYPLTNPGGGAYYDSTFNGSDDGFMVKFSKKPLSLITSIVNAGCLCTGSATVSPCPYYTYLWSDGQTTETAIHLCSGTYNVLVTDTIMCNEQATAFVTLDSSDAVILVNSPTICAGDTALLIASGADTYTWSAGAIPADTNTAAASPVTTTTYTVTGVSVGCSGTALATVTVDPLPAVSINSAIICAGDTALLIASGAVNYVWSTSDTTSSIHVTPSTTTAYSIIGSAAGCVDSATSIVTVNPLPVASVTGTTVCAGSTIYLSSSGGGTYSWSGPGSFTSGMQNPAIPTATSLNSGNYIVTVSDGLCTDTAIAVVIVNPLPVISISNDTVINIGSAAPLIVSGGTEYSWNPGAGLSCVNCPAPTATPKQTTTYCVIVDNGICIDSACVTVTVEVPCPDVKELNVPDAFSPNNDGSNDFFLLQGWNNCMQEFNIIIYNRWGEKIFESDNVSFQWDGMYNGKMLDPGVFVYYINAKLLSDLTIEKKGNITLIR